MTTILEPDPRDPKSVKAGSTCWRLWESDGDVYYATRGTVTDAEMGAGCEATLVANTPSERVKKILAQPDIPQAVD